MPHRNSLIGKSVPFPQLPSHKPKCYSFFLSIRKDFQPLTVPSPPVYQHIPLPIQPLVDEVELLYHRLLDLEQNIISFDSQESIPKDVGLFQDEINELQEDFTAMLKALISLLDGAKYLWESKEI